MMARAADGPPSGESVRTASPIPRATFCIGSLTPMTPVDATSTAAGAIASAAAVSVVISCACCMPSAPVQALAQPLLTTTAPIWPAEACRLARETRTGGACARFVVKTAAAEAGVSDTMTARSSPLRRMPAWTPAATAPAFEPPAPVTDDVTAEADSVHVHVWWDGVEALDRHFLAARRADVDLLGAWPQLVVLYAAIVVLPAVAFWLLWRHARRVGADSAATTA